MSDIEFGVVQVTDARNFYDPTGGLSKDARVEKTVENLLSEGRPQGVGDWPRVHEKPIRRGGVFIVETTSTSFKATLRFCPERAEIGDYEIRPLRRGAVESGRTVKVTAVPADETDARLSMLTPFATRYVVETVGAERPYECKIWRVGLKDFRVVDATDDTV